VTIIASFVSYEALTLASFAAPEGAVSLLGQPGEADIMPDNDHAAHEQRPSVSRGPSVHDER
jgi:hypothetical protein